MKALLVALGAFVMAVLVMVVITLRKWVLAISPLTREMTDLHADLRKFNEALQERYDGPERRRQPR